MQKLCRNNKKKKSNNKMKKQNAQKTQNYIKKNQKLLSNYKNKNNKLLNHQDRHKEKLKLSNSYRRYKQNKKKNNYQLGVIDKLLEQNQKKRLISAKNWIEQEQEPQRQKELLIERKKQVKQQEEELAHILAKKYRETHPQSSFEEYLAFEPKKGKKIDIQTFNFINSRTVKHDLNKQKSAMELAIQQEEAQKLIQIQKQQEKDSIQQKIKKKRQFSQQQKKESEITNSVNQTNMSIKDYNRQKYAETVFEKTFLEKNQTLLQNNSQINRKKELLEKRKAYGRQVSQERKKQINKSKEKENLQQEQAFKEKNSQSKIHKNENQIIKNIPNYTNIDENKQFEVQKQEQLVQNVNQFQQTLKSEQSQEKISNIEDNSSFELTSSSDSQYDANQENNLESIEIYIKQQEQFLQKIEQQKQLYEYDLQKESLQDKIFSGKIEIQSDCSNILVDQFLRPNKQFTSNQNLIQKAIDNNQAESIQNNNQIKQSTQNKNNFINQDLQQILIKNDIINKEFFSAKQQGQNINKELETVKSKSLHLQEQSIQEINDFLQESQNQNNKNLENQNKKFDFFEIDQSNRLDDYFQKRKQDFENKNKPNKERKEKTKEELIQYRKNMMKSQKRQKIQNQQQESHQLSISQSKPSKKELLMHRLASGEISQKEMKEINQRHFQSLPEQQKKLKEFEKKENAKLRSQKMKEMSDVIQIIKSIRRNIMKK